MSNDNSAPSWRKYYPAASGIALGLAVFLEGVALLSEEGSWLRGSMGMVMFPGAMIGNLLVPGGWHSDSMTYSVVAWASTGLLWGFPLAGFWSWRLQRRRG